MLDPYNLLCVPLGGCCLCDWICCSSAAWGTKSGPVFTISEAGPGESGQYYCEARNRIGTHNSPVLTVRVRGRSPYHGGILIQTYHMCCSCFFGLVGLCIWWALSWAALPPWSSTHQELINKVNPTDHPSVKKLSGIYTGRKLQSTKIMWTFLTRRDFLLLLPTLEHSNLYFPHLTLE